RRDNDVTSFGGAAYDTNDGQSVAEAGPQAFVVLQQLFFNLFGSLGAFFQEALFFFLAFGEDVVKFVLLVIEVFSAFGDEGVGLFDFFFLRGDEFFGFFGALLADLDFQFLKLYFLGDRVEFPVVPDVLLLFGVFLDQFFRLLSPFLVFLDAFLQFLQFVLKSCQPCFVSFYLIFQVLNLVGEVPPQLLKL